MSKFAQFPPSASLRLPYDRDVLYHHHRHYTRNGITDTAVGDVDRELGIGVTAYGVLSRGLLSGSIPAQSGDFRAYMPRFRRQNPVQNGKLAETLRLLAVERGVSAVQLAIAWVLAKDEGIVPAVGARIRAQLSESLAAWMLSSLNPKYPKLSGRFRNHRSPAQGMTSTR